MNLTRREVVRRIGGLSVFAALFGASRLVTGRAVTDSSNVASLDEVLGANGSATCTIEGPSGSVDDTRNREARTRGSTTTEAVTESTTTTHHMDETTPTVPSTVTTVPLGNVQLLGIVGPLTIPGGITATIVGDVTLGGDLIIEGLLTGVDTFTLDGKGFQILVQKGGQVDLAGKAKTGWARVGDSVSNWSAGDRLAIAPTASGDFSVKYSTWGGGWSGIGAPAAITLLDGRVFQPEVVNLTRSITLKNLARFMFHMGAGPSTLKHIAVVDSGRKLDLGFYPIHFHMNGNTVHGSLVEGVVVENGANHAFVPHGSHGIHIKDCAAVAILDNPYWWDEGGLGTPHFSEDIFYDRCLALGVVPGDPNGQDRFRLSGFNIGAAKRSMAIGCAAAAVQPGGEGSGFWWAGGSGNTIEGWLFDGCVAHNNKDNGIAFWTNAEEPHLIQNFVGYRNGKYGVDHGAYLNAVRYHGMVLQENGAYPDKPGGAVTLHSNSRASGPSPGQTFQDVLTDGELAIDSHALPTMAPTYQTRASYSRVRFFKEMNQEPSIQLFADCGLAPADFDLAEVNPNTVIELWESGQLLAKATGGAWA
jgi:hypothetical protein